MTRLSSLFMRALRAFVLALAGLSLVACQSGEGIDASMASDSGGSSVDAGSPPDSQASLPDSNAPVNDAANDALVPVDAGSADAAPAVDQGILDQGTLDQGILDQGTLDQGTLDQGPRDQGILDQGTRPDTGPMVGDSAVPDAGGPCNTLTFASLNAVPIRVVASLPADTGGTIPLGTYDCVDVQTTSTLALRGFLGTWVFESPGTLQTLEQGTIPGVPTTPIRRTWTWSNTSPTAILQVGACNFSSQFVSQYSVRTVGGTTYLDVRQNLSILYTYRLR